MYFEKLYFLLTSFVLQYNMILQTKSDQSLIKFLNIRNYCSNLWRLSQTTRPKTLCIAISFKRMILSLQKAGPIYP